MILYRTPRGRPVENFSNAQADMLRFCPHKYILSRHLGLGPAKTDANLHFGNCAEEAIRTYHRAGLSPVQMFESLWEAAVREHGQTINWEGWKTPETLSVAGANLMRAYLHSHARLGIRRATFFTYAEREQFTRDIGVELQSVPDCIDDPEPHPRWGAGPRVIDIKCPDSSPSLPCDGMAALDEQLRAYSYTTGLRRVALLLLIKGNPDSEPKAGSTRTYLGPSKELLGRQVRVIEATKKTGTVVQLTENGGALGVPFAPEPGSIANVRLVLIEGSVTEEAAEATARSLREEAERQARRWSAYESELEQLDTDQSSISYAEFEQRRRSLLRRNFPQRPGFRFPNDRCSWCEMLGECLDRPDISAERLVRIDEKWLEEL